MVQLHRMRLHVDDSSLIPVLDAIRAELKLPDSFPPEVDAQVAAACEEWDAFCSRVRPRSSSAVAPSSVDEDGASNPGRTETTGPEPLLDLPELEGANAAANGPWTSLVPGALPMLDATEIPFVTIDPESSRDLDQAVHLARLPEGREDGAVYLVDYAIASLATFVAAGSPLDAEVRSRALTVYLPDHSTPLHPTALSEGSASLLPDRLAPACAWRILLDASGEIVSATVRRALVRSRAKLSYEGVDAWRSSGEAIAGAPADLVELLGEIGEKRRALETRRGGVSSPTPEQEITRATDPDGSTHYELDYRHQSPVEEWNAQVSLLTGISAARIMREAGLAILRTVPPAPPVAFERLRQVAALLGVDWPADVEYSDLVPTLDPANPRHEAFLTQAMSLYRGAGYTVFANDPSSLAPTAVDEGGAAAPTPAGEGGPGSENAPAADGPGAPTADDADERPSAGAAPVPFPPLGDPSTEHAAIAAEYAHATAPLRRLVDRWSSEICLAHEAGEPAPEWLLDSLLSVPSLMAEGGRKAAAAERNAIGAVSAKLLLGHEGEAFHGVIVERNDARGDADRGHVVIDEPAVQGSVFASDKGETLPLGEQTVVVLASADVARRKVRFKWNGPTA